MYLHLFQPFVGNGFFLNKEPQTNTEGGNMVGARTRKKTERNGVHVGLQSEQINCSGGWQVNDLQRHVNPEDLSVGYDKLWALIPRGCKSIFTLLLLQIRPERGCIQTKFGGAVKMQVFPFVFNKAHPFSALVVCATAGTQNKTIKVRPRLIVRPLQLHACFVNRSRTGNTANHRTPQILCSCSRTKMSRGLCFVRAACRRFNVGKVNAVKEIHFSATIRYLTLSFCFVSTCRRSSNVSCAHIYMQSDHFIVFNPSSW